MSELRRGRGIFGRVVSEALGFRTMTGIIKSTIFPQLMVLNFVRSIVDRIMMPPPVCAIPADLQDDHDRFAAALESSGVRDKDVEGLRRKFALRAQVFLAASILLIALSITSWVRPGGPINTWLTGGAGGSIGYILPVIISLPMLAMFFRWSFFSFQLRHRRLCGALMWFRTPSEWLPPDMVSGEVQALILFATGLAGVHFGMHPAFAQTVTPSGGGMGTTNVFQALIGSVPQGDLSMQVLSRLFPSYFSFTGISYQQDAVAQMMQVVNTALVGMASVMVTWHSVSAVITSASEGEVLGRRYHTTQSVLRVGIGFSSLIPAGGFCAAQVLAMQMILAGCGLANLGWQTYVGATTGTDGAPVAITAAPASISSQKLFDQVVDAAVCMKLGQYEGRTVTAGSNSNNAAAGSVISTLGFFGINPQPFVDPTKGGNGATKGIWNFGTACGQFVFPVPSSAPAAAPASGQSSTTGAGYPTSNLSGLSVDPTVIATSQGSFYRARAIAFDAFIKQVVDSSFVKNATQGSAAGGDVDLSTVDLNSELAQLEADYATYNKAVLTAAGQFAGSAHSAEVTHISNAGLSGHADALGWIGAGAMEPRLAAISMDVESEADQRPTVNVGSLLLAGLDFRKSFLALQKTIQSFEYSLLYGGSPNANANPNTPESEQNLVAAITSGSNPWSATGTFLATRIDAWIMNETAINSSNPVAEISTMGIWVKGAGYSLLAAYALASVVELSGKVISSASQADPDPESRRAAALAGTITQGVAGGVARMLYMIAIPLVVLGIVMEYIVPMMAYMIWISAVIGWGLFAIEVIVCMPFTGFSMITVEGDEMFSQKQGYGMNTLLIAMFYPILMLFGLIIGTVAVSVFVALINNTFTIASQSAIGTMHDPIGLVVVIALRTVFYYQAVSRSYRLISMIPEYVANYYGSSASARRDDTHNTATNTLDQFRGSVNRKTETVTKALVGAGGDR